MSTIPKICLGKEVAREGFSEEGVCMCHFTYHQSGLMAAFQGGQAFLGVEQGGAEQAAVAHHVWIYPCALVTTAQVGV